MVELTREEYNLIAERRGIKKPEVCLLKSQ